MPLTLISGPLNSGKTHTLLTKLSKVVNKGRACYVVPNESIADELRHLFLNVYFAPQHRLAIIGDIFVSFDQFMRLLKPSGAQTINAHQRVLMLYRLFKQQPLRYFAETNLSLGIAREAAETIARLKRNKVTPEKLHSLLEMRGTLREFDLLILFQNYEREMKRLRLRDGEDLYLAQWREIPFDTIFFDEFFEFEPGQLDIIRTLNESSPSPAMTLTLPEADSQKLLYAEEAQRNIEKIRPLCNEHIRLAKRETAEPNITLLSVRSPVQEARLLAQETTPQTRVVCRIDSDLPGLLLSERGQGLGAGSPPLIAHLLSTAFKDDSPAEAPLEVYIDRLRTNLHAVDLLDVWKKELFDDQVQEEVARSIVLLARLEERLNALEADAKLLRIESMSKEAFLELIRSAFEMKFWSTQNTFPLSITFFESGTATETDQLFIPEMAEGWIPRTTSDRLFFNEQHDFSPTSNDLLDTLFPSSEALLSLEAYRFHSFLAKAKQEVILSISSIDESGSERHPSSFLEEFGIPVALDLPPQVSPHFLEGEARRRLMEKAEIELERMRGGFDRPNFHGRLTDAKALELIRSRFQKERFSPSRLETYAECPFRFYLEKVLGLQPKDEISPEILPRDRGTIIHAVLERFYREHTDLLRAARGEPAREEEILLIVERILEKIFAEHADLISRSSFALRSFQRKAIQSVVEGIILAELRTLRELPEAPFPRQCEWIFGQSEKEALRVPVPGEPDALLQGRVDRIDTTNDGRAFLVIDYKTGSLVESIHQKMIDGLHLQLPIYVKAVQDLFLPQSFPLGGLLFAVMTVEKKAGFLKKEYNDVQYAISKRSRSLLEEEEWEAMMQRSLAYVGEYVSQIRAGKFMRADQTSCQHCKFQEACRKC